MNSLLVPFWIKDGRFANLGFGVTAYSKEDAVYLLRKADIALNINFDDLFIKKNIHFEELDQKHIVPNMGPINLRGIWFPFLNL